MNQTENITISEFKQYLNDLRKVELSNKPLIDPVQGTLRDIEKLISIFPENCGNIGFQWHYHFNKETLIIYLEDFIHFRLDINHTLIFLTSLDYEVFTALRYEMGSDEHNLKNLIIFLRDSIISLIKGHEYFTNELQSALDNIVSLIENNNLPLGIQMANNLYGELVEILMKDLPNALTPHSS